MKQAAAIRRASNQAQYAMQDLDRRGVEDLLILYGRAAEEVRARIAAAVDAQQEVPAYRLRELLVQIEAVVDGLGVARDLLVVRAINQAAELGVRPYTLAGLGVVGGEQAVLTSAAAMRISEQAVRFVRDFTLADGLTLSDRLWRIDQGARTALTRAIGQAVVMGQSAARAAQDFMLAGQATPGELVARIAAGKAGELAAQASTLTDRRSGAFMQVERVFRTEINRAHGEAYMAGAAQAPGFAGFRFLLSPEHPAPDICFRRGTLVLTRRGEIPIEDVRLGDEALTHLGRWRPVVRLYRSASGPSGLVRLCFPGANSRSQEVVMTPNHPVLTPQGWQAAGDLQTGSAVVCALPAVAGPPPPAGAGAGCTASRGSGETASAGAGQTTGPAQCGAHAQPQHRTPRTLAAGALPPSGLPTFGAAKCRACQCHPSMPGYPRLCAAQTAIGETPPCVETGPGVACQSSGCRPPSWGGTPCSNTAASCCSQRAQTVPRTWGKPWAWLRALLGSTRQSNTPAPALSPCAAGLQRPPHSQGTPPACACPGSSTLPNMHGCKTVWSWTASLAPTVLAWGAGACRSVRRALSGASCAHDIAFTTQHPFIEKLPATGEEVFNLEVQDDHSYVANGLVVHNCDLLAAQNLHGLGAGVYPDRARCPWPAHPNTLSFVVMVFAEEVGDAERAGQESALQALQRMAPEIREGALGKTKATYFDKGLLGTGMIRAPLRAVQARMDRQAQRSAAPERRPDALPNLERAVLPSAKLAGYVLKPNHPTGQHKARVFASVLGFTAANVGDLAAAIHAALPRSQATVRQTTQYGTLYSADLALTGPAGSAIVRTGWIVEPGDDVPRLTSAYVKNTHSTD